MSTVLLPLSTPENPSQSIRGVPRVCSGPAHFMCLASQIVATTAKTTSAKPRRLQIAIPNIIPPVPMSHAPFMKSPRCSNRDPDLPTMSDGGLIGAAAVC